MTQPAGDLQRSQQQIILVYTETVTDLDRTLKNPMTATSLSAIKDSASVTPARVATAGPVRFFSQLTMSSACLPAAREQNTTAQTLLCAHTLMDLATGESLSIENIISCYASWILMDVAFQFHTSNSE